MDSGILYLYGPPASGKSTLARRLAGEFGVEAVDLDAAIVERAGKPIPQIFAESGEGAFRALESETLREIASPVVALGGGTLLDPANRAYAEEHGFVAVIDADEETLARRIEAASGTRPLGNKYRERREHYASFAHHIAADTRILLPGALSGALRVPASKSHLHRLLIAQFLAGVPLAAGDRGECEDIRATRRCLAALAEAAPGGAVTLDCGESGSTLRFLAPLAAALGHEASFIRRGRLAERPMLEYHGLESGVHELPGDVSSQFVTGLLFALPLLKGDSRIVFSSPLQSRGYVDMTLDVVRAFGIEVVEEGGGFSIRGSQRFVAPEKALAPEGDWSGASFWLAANKLGARVEIENLNYSSRQPDRTLAHVLENLETAGEIDISQFPDAFPALVVAAAAVRETTRIVNAARLRIKESDRIAAMEKTMTAFGVAMESTADTATIHGNAGAWRPCEIDAAGDHRIAMAAAIASTRAAGPVLIHGASCVTKSYPAFFDDFLALRRG